MSAADLATRLSRKELLLLLIYAPSGDSGPNAPIRGRTRLAKMVFLFRRELWGKFRFGKIIPESALPVFRPWRFGPYSKEVFSDIDFFRAVGFLETESSEPASREEALELSYWSGTQTVDYGASDEDVGNEYAEEIFKLSPAGVRYVETKGFWELLSEEQRTTLRAFKGRMTSAPLRAILAYVYKQYPDMAEESEIKHEFSF